MYVYIYIYIYIYIYDAHGQSNQTAIDTMNARSLKAMRTEIARQVHVFRVRVNYEKKWANLTFASRSADASADNERVRIQWRGRTPLQHSSLEPDGATARKTDRELRGRRVTRRITPGSTAIVAAGDHREYTVHLGVAVPLSTQRVQYIPASKSATGT